MNICDNSGYFVGLMFDVDVFFGFGLAPSSSNGVIFLMDMSLSAYIVEFGVMD